MSALQERLREMHLRGMLEAYEEQMQTATCHQLSFEERFTLLVDREWTKRQNMRQARLLKEARFRVRAARAPVDYRIVL